MATSGKLLLALGNLSTSLYAPPSPSQPQLKIRLVGHHPDQRSTPENLG